MTQAKMKAGRNERCVVMIEGLERRCLFATVDTIIFGNTTSETAHTLTQSSSQVITGGLSQSARQLLPLSTVDVNGGNMTFTMTVDPAQRNYFSVKFWGNDDTDQGKGRLYLYVPISGVNYQVGYRHEGDYTPLNQVAGASPLPNRFFYSTTMLPLWMTQGKTSLTLKIQSAGELYGLGSGGPPSGNYQMNMDTASRGIYRAYVHNEPMLDVGGETQGTAPTVTTRPAVTESSILGTTGTYTTGLKNWVLGKLSANVATFTASDVQMIANSYAITQFGWTTTQKNSIVSKVIAAIDGFTSDYYTNPASSVDGSSGYGGAGGNESWGGRFGPLGWAVHLLSTVSGFTSQLDTSTNYGAVGGTLVRRQAWGDMLAASRDYGRFNRRTLTNQTILANINIYKANRALIDLGDVDAFTETAAQRYLKESVGIEPWLGDDLPGGGSDNLYGTDYFQTTLDGLTREWGYVGGYSEMALYAANFYRWTGNTQFKDQAVKMLKATANMRRPAIEVSGASNYRTMERIGILAWRGVREADGYFKNDISYANQASWSAGMIVAGTTLDPYAIGYAKQMLADNQYLNNLVSDSRYYASLTFDSLNAFDVYTDYFAVKNATDSGIRLPMTSGQPDYAWADEQDGIVAIKKGETRLWISSYWQAKAGTGINGVGRFHYSTPTYDQYGTLETTPNYTFNGEYFVRPDYVDMPEQNGYVPPDNPTQAYAGELLPIATAPGNSQVDTPYRGKADFWALRFGNFLIGINEHASNSYTLKTPTGFTSATDLITNTSKTGTISVGPNSSIALYLASATDPSPVPNAPLLVRATGSSTQVVLNWTAASGAATYNVKRATSAAGPFTTISTGLTATTFTDTAVTAGAAYYYVVSASNANGEGYDSSDSPVSAGLPTGWASQDIGSVALAGSASVIDSVHTVRGSGSDIGGASDSMHFEYKTLSGDGVIVARLTNAGYTNGSDKIGLMFRESLTGGSKTAALVWEDQSNVARLANRSSTGGGMNWSSASDAVSSPYWIKLQRVGSTFTGFISPDGVAWTSIASATLSMNTSLYVGLFACSRYTQQVNVSTFDNVVVNGFPSVTAAAAAAPASVSGVSTVLSVLGTDDGGESKLTYTWATIGTPPAQVAFTSNGTNGAKSATAMFIQAGTYTLQCVVSDGMLTASSSVIVTVASTLKVLELSPDNVTLQLGQTQQFSVVAYDQFGEVMTTPGVVWSLAGGSVGSVNASGIYTTSASGNATVIATNGSIIGSATVSIASASPTLVTAATVGSTNVTGTSVSLDALGTDDGGEAALSYTWSVVSGPASVLFSSNGNNGAKNTIATFHMAGAYVFAVAIRDVNGNTITSSVSLTVAQTPTKLTVSPPSVSMGTNSIKQFSAKVTDQFGAAIPSPAVTWSVVSGSGSVSSSGLYTASAITGKAAVRATLAGKTATATVNVFAWSPYNLTARRASASTVAVNFKDSTTIETGFQLQIGQRQSNGSILWTTLYAIAAASGSGSTVNFTVPESLPGGPWYFRVRAVSGTALSNWSNSALVGS